MLCDMALKFNTVDKAIGNLNAETNTRKDQARRTEDRIAEVVEEISLLRVRLCVYCTCLCVSLCLYLSFCLFGPHDGSVAIAGL